MAITEAELYFADTFPGSKRLIATDPIATPMEKMARNRLATSLLAVNTFFTKGGKMMMRIDPIIQKKLMAQIARNNLGMCMVIPISRQDDRSTLWSISMGSPISGAGRSVEHTSDLQSLMSI